MVQAQLEWADRFGPCLCVVLPGHATRGGGVELSVAGAFVAEPRTLGFCGTGES